MAEEIRQRLGFDATGAITGIDNLVNAFGRLNKALRETSENFKRFNQGKVTKNMRNLAQAAGRAAVATRTLAEQSGTFKKLDNSIKGTTRSSQSLLLSWQTLARIALAQGIVRSLNTIQALFREAIDTAQDYGLALAEAAAIAPAGIDNFQNSVDSLNKSLIETSNAFGFDVLDLAEAKYQEFSNQVRGSADSQRLFINANKLARISASEVGEAVGAISSVLNSYDQSVENSDRVSAALFKTIELGRLRLSDIADQLGNVTPLARGAGIEFEELGGALTTITRSGVSPSRALTQIRALINQLTKPTKELQELFTNVFQVANIEEAIQKFGSLEGVITAIGEASGGSTSRVAELFTNIRAKTAFDSLNSQIDLLRENVDKIGDAADEGATFLDNLLKEFDEQDAVAFTKAINELKNTFLEFAQNALPTITSGIRGLTVALDNFGSVLTVLGAGVVGSFGVKLLGLSKAAEAGATTGLAAMIGKGGAGAAGSTGLIGIGVAAGIAINQLARFADKAAAAAREAEILEGVEAFKELNLERINKEATDTINALQEIDKQGTKAFQTLINDGKAAIDIIRGFNKQFASTLGGGLDDVVKIQSNRVKELEEIISGARDRQIKNAEEQADIQAKIDDRVFERGIRGRDELTQAILKQQRAQDALNKTQGDFAGSFGFGEDEVTQESLAKRLEELERAEKLARDAVSAALGTGNRAAVFKAEETLDDILRRQLETKKEQQAFDERQVAIANKKKAAEQARLDELKENVKILKDNLSLFNEDGALLSKADRDQAIKNAKEAFDNIQNQAISRDDLSIDKILGIADLSLRFNEQLGRFNLDPITEGLPEALQRAASAQTIKVPIEFTLQSAGALDLDTSGFDPTQPIQGLLDLRKQALQNLTENAQVQQRLNGLANDEAGVRKEIADKIQEIVDFNNNSRIAQDSPVFAERILKDTTELEQKLQEIANRPGILPEGAFEEVRDLLNEFNKGIEGPTDLPGTGLFGGETETINRLIEAYGRLREAQLARQPGRAEEGRIATENENLTNFIRNVDNAIQKQGELRGISLNIGGSIDAAFDAQGNFTGAVEESKGEVVKLGGQYKVLEGQIDDATEAQKRLNKAQAQSGPAAGPETRFGGFRFAKMFGGALYRRGGGFSPRGTDTVPAMLSPGEFVVKASSARKFASQLQSINAGVTPVFRQEGGVVNNSSVNIGDINVNGTSDPDATARRVMAEIRRERRRGTSNLR